DELIGVATLRNGDDVLLATRLGRCTRFQATHDQLRVFAGRDSSGVRGIRLAEGKNRDSVISMSVLRHVEASPGERSAYLRQANARRRNGHEEEGEAPALAENGAEADEGGEEVTL